MNGSTVKEILKREGVNLTRLAGLLGYPSNQALHAVLKHDDVRSGLLENIAKVLGKDMNFFYCEIAQKQNAVVNDEGIAVAGSNVHINSSIEEYIALLKKKDEQIDRLLTIIEKR